MLMHNNAIFFFFDPRLHCVQNSCANRRHIKVCIHLLIAYKVQIWLIAPSKIGKKTIVVKYELASNYTNNMRQLFKDAMFIGIFIFSVFEK